MCLAASHRSIDSAWHGAMLTHADWLRGLLVIHPQSAKAKCQPVCKMHGRRAARVSG
jgi:hypothetical protein